MIPVVAQLPKDQIIAELTPDKLLRKTNNGNNEVYLFDNNNSPALMHEVGRVREITFRHAGGGTGNEIDIDEFDTAIVDPQKQLIVWDPDNKEVIGGYRFYFPSKSQAEYDINKLASSSYFHFSERFMKQLLSASDGAGKVICSSRLPDPQHGQEESFRTG